MLVRPGTGFWAPIPGDTKVPPDDHPAIVLHIEGDRAMVAFGTSGACADPFFEAWPTDAVGRALGLQNRTRFDRSGIKVIALAQVHGTCFLFDAHRAIRRRLSV